ncbi:hypothetical protein F4777DRAFT_566022 [Nemania sp. FL0916]|nr:hypothetical protein F4777DRAFT_566022 [Nemania sp. FL0916]
MATNGNSESIYILNSGPGQSEQDRLNAQHHLFTALMQGDMLPPHIASSLSALPAPKVMDIATGSGVWLYEIGKTLSPDAELVGLDFDTSKFPSSPQAPNITLRQANMLEPFTSDLLGKFDVVHMRLILYALKAGYAVDLMKNIMTLLKPGGYVVWSETGPLYTTIQPPSKAWFKFQEYNWEWAQQYNADPGLPVSMQHYMKQAGYVECDDKVYIGNAQLYDTKNGKDWQSRMTSQCVTFITQAIPGLISLGGVKGLTTEEEANQLIAELREELPGRNVNHTFVRAWGRKSTTA